MNLPELMTHIKYQLPKLDIEHPRAAQNLGHIGTSISYFLNINHEVPYKLHTYNEYNYEKYKDERNSVIGYVLFNNAVPFLLLGIVINLF